MDISSKLTNLIKKSSNMQKDITALDKKTTKIQKNATLLQKDVSSLKVLYSTLDQRLEENNKLIKSKYSDIFNLVDGLASEIKDQRDFRSITTHNISSHHKRLNKLEKVVLTT